MSILPPGASNETQRRHARQATLQGGLVAHAALRSDLEQLWSAHNQASDGGTEVEAEYLEVAAIRA